MAHVKEEADHGLGITFSKVKYRLQNMLTEVRALKSKEHAARTEADCLIQKLRLIEAEHERVKVSLHAQINESAEARQKLENTVKMMSLEVAAMENKVKGSKMQLKAVLETRNTALEELKITKYELEQKLKNVTSRLAVAVEKLSRNSMLFEAVESEASSVKLILDETRQLVASRADNVAKLEQQVAWMVGAEQTLIDKVRTLESELKNKQLAVIDKDKEILALKQLLETKENDCHNQLKLAIIQNASEVKERTIATLLSDKQDLLSETERLNTLVQKLQVGAQEQDAALQITREKLLSLQLLVEEKATEAEERQQLRDLKEQVVAKHVNDIQRFEEEKVRWLESHQRPEVLEQSTSTDDLLEPEHDASETEVPPDKEDGVKGVLQAEPSVALIKLTSEKTGEDALEFHEEATSLEETKQSLTPETPVAAPSIDVEQPLSTNNMQSGEGISAKSVKPEDGEHQLEACPDDTMVNCSNCESEFHVKCVPCEEVSSAYMCPSCKDQPAKKKSRLDSV